MKKLIFILTLVLAVVSCKNNEPKKPFIIDTNAMVNLKPDVKNWAKAPQFIMKSSNSATHLTPLEIVQQAVGISWTYNNKTGDRGFNNEQRDVTSNPPMLKMFASDIINIDQYNKPYYEPAFIEGVDCILFRSYNNKRDTIGYIPNAILRAAQPLIKSAYDNGDNETVYRLFNEAFTFLPITAAEWQDLKKQGKQ